MKSDLEEIKDRLDIVDVVSDYVALKKAGQNWKGLCPFHSEKTPSFTVSPSKQIFYCFGCSTGGDIFSFLMKLESLSFQESLNILAKRAGVELKKSPSRAKDEGEKGMLFNMHRDAVLFFQKRLQETREARAYLDRRGVTSEAISLFSLGYAPERWDALFLHLKDKKYGPEMIKKAGLAVYGSKGYHDTFRNRIMFPIRNLQDEIVAFGGRVMDNSLPKYLNSPETPVFSKSRTLYALNLAKETIRKTGCALFMEGYLDVITAHMNGFTNVVAPLGTAVTGEHGRLVKRFAEDAVIVFDGDPPGLKAASNGMSVLLEVGLNAKALALPAGEDPDSFLKKQGREAFAVLLEHAESPVDFFVSQALAGRSPKREEHVVVRQVLEVISMIPDRSLQGYYVKQLSERMNINEYFIREQLMKVREKGHPQGTDKGRTPRSATGRSSGRPMDEVYLIQVLLQTPEMSGEVFGFVSDDDFEDPVTRSIYGTIRNAVETTGTPLNYDTLVHGCTDEEKTLVTELFCRDTLENPEKVLSDCLKRLKSKKHRSVLHELQMKIKKAEQDKDEESLRGLLQEKQRHLRMKG